MTQDSTLPTQTPAQNIAAATSLSALVFAGAIFGFFYAWVCSTMWGLDAADPRTAIDAMNAMNGSVRNSVFAPAFFGTPLILAIATLLLIATGPRASAYAFAIATFFAIASIAITFIYHIPLNVALMEISAPEDVEKAREIWTAYSGEWQVWNQIRTVTSGLALAAAGYGLFRQRRA